MQFSPTEPSTHHRKYTLLYEWAIVAAAAILIVFVLVAGGWTWKLDQFLYDTGLALDRHTPRDDIVLVTIDDNAIAAIGKWPWRRAVVADLLERIAPAKPRSVGLDILFSESDLYGFGDDQLLAAAMTRVPNVFLPVVSVQGRQLMPIRELAERARLVGVGGIPDSDGVLRSVVLEQGMSGRKIPHMALAMAECAGANVPEDQLESYLIPFTGPPGTIRHVSAAAVLRGEVPPAAFAGKFVLIGITADGLADGYFTPTLTGRLPMSGVEVTANVLSGLLDGRHIRQSGIFTVGFVSAGAMLILLLVFYRVGPTVSLLSMYASVVLIPLSALFLLTMFGIWFAPMSVTISALIAYPLWNWKRLEAICRYLDEEIVRLGSEHSGTDAVRPSSLIGFAGYIQNRIELIRVNIGYLRAARKFLTESLDGLPYAALVVAPDGRLVIANRHAVDLCDLDRGGLAECQIEEAMQRIKPLGSNWKQATRSALNDGSIELKAADEQGREFEASLASFRNDEGIVSGLILVLEDVTVLRQAQREREEALSFLSHDIRSPQNSIMALAQLQRQPETGKTESEFVDQVESLAKKTVMLAEDFLQLVRADSKPLNLAEYDLSALMEDCMLEIAPQAKAKQIELCIFEPTDKLPILVDRSLALRAIGNLAGNAVKYTPPHGRITVRCEALEQYAICSIEDTGPGVDEADFPKLFKRFSRVHGRGVDVGGSGLGLAFVDVVARRHRGHAAVKSLGTKGTTFSIAFPLVADAADIETYQ